MQHYSMNLKLKVWRQKNSHDQGHFETYNVKDISSEMSFLEMIDVLNERLITEGADPIAFDHDCRVCVQWLLMVSHMVHGKEQRHVNCT